MMLNSIFFCGFIQGMSVTKCGGNSIIIGEPTNVVLRYVLISGSGDSWILGFLDSWIHGFLYSSILWLIKAVHFDKKFIFMQYNQVLSVSWLTKTTGYQ